MFARFMTEKPLFHLQNRLPADFFDDSFKKPKPPGLLADYGSSSSEDDSDEDDDKNDAKKGAKKSAPSPIGLPTGSHCFFL